DDLDLESGRREAVAQNDLPHGRATDVSGADDGDARNTHPESLRRALWCATKLGGIRPGAPRFVISPSPTTPAGPRELPARSPVEHDIGLAPHARRALQRDDAARGVGREHAGSGAVVALLLELHAQARHLGRELLHLVLEVE